MTRAGRATPRAGHAEVAGSEDPARDRDAPVALRRLTRGDAIAAVAALALLLAMAMDWYGTKLGDEARRIEETARSEGAVAGEVGRRLREDARVVAEREERNAWQAGGAVDRVLLGSLLAAAALALGAGALRAAGRRPGRLPSPSGLAAAAGSVGAVLIAYRMLEQPGLDAEATVKAGALLGLLAVAALALGAADALRAEERGTAWKEAAGEAETAPGGAGA